MSPRQDPHSAAPFPLPIGSFLAAAVIYVIDAFLLNQGVLAVLVALVAILALLPAAIAGALARSWRAPLVWALRAAVFTMAAAGVIATNTWQNWAARRRAEQVIDACERYRADSGRYPDALADLVPRYLPSEPRAKYTLMFGRFDYSASATHHSLMYVSLPPFGRPYYRFEDRRWGYLD